MKRQTRCRHTWRLCAIIALFLAACLLPAAAMSDQDAELLMKRTILSLYKVRTSIVDRQTELQTQGAVSLREQDEAMLFVTYLDGRIYHYCRHLYLGVGPAGLAGLPCPLNPLGEMEPGRFTPVPENPGQTRTEKAAQLDQELNSALGEFDDMLLKEEEKVAAHIPRQREGSESASGGRQEGSATGQSGDEGDADSASTDAEGQNGSVAGSASDESDGGENSRANEGGVSGSSSRSQLPQTESRNDIPTDGDDIVARQLREAAEQETDPEVKEKLWEEYRKYKEGIR